MVGSSALHKAKNKEELASKVKELTGLNLHFLDKEGEIFYNLIGSIPPKYRTKALLIDIGSGNTKIGYLEGENLRTVSLEIPFGTVSLAEKAKEGNPSFSAYLSNLSKISQREVSQSLPKEAQRKPPLLNRSPVFLVGGIVWAMTTILYPENQNSFVELKAGDIDRFYNLLTQKREGVFEVDLSKIKDAEIRQKAEKQIQAVSDVFTVENLTAGATLLRDISGSLKLKGRKLYFARAGNWLFGYIALRGIEKAEREEKR